MQKKNVAIALVLFASTLALGACGTAGSPLSADKAAGRPSHAAEAPVVAPIGDGAAPLEARIAASRKWAEAQFAAHGLPTSAAAPTRHLLGLGQVLMPLLTVLCAEEGTPTPMGPTATQFLQATAAGQQLCLSGWVSYNDIQPALGGDQPFDAPRHPGAYGWPVEQHLGPDGTGGVRYAAWGDDAQPGGHAFSDYYDNNGTGGLWSYRVMTAGPFWEIEQSALNPGAGFRAYDVQWTAEDGYHHIHF